MFVAGAAGHAVLALLEIRVAPSMSSPSTSASAHAAQTSDVERYFRRNYLFHGVEGGLFMGGMAFVSPQMVLPRMVQELDGSDWLVALTPVSMMLGFTAPGIFVMHRIQRLERLHRFVMLFGLIQRPPYLVAGMLLLGGVTGKLAMLAVSATPLLSGLAGGFSAVAWIEFVARCIQNAGARRCGPRGSCSEA